jgi:hypothetical protein
MPTRRRFLSAIASLCAAAGLSRLAGGADGRAARQPGGYGGVRGIARCVDAGRTAGGVVASGDVNYWVGPATGTAGWGTAANWSLGTVPVTGEHVRLRNSQPRSTRPKRNRP